MSDEIRVYIDANDMNLTVQVPDEGYYTVEKFDNGFIIKLKPEWSFTKDWLNTKE